MSTVNIDMGAYQLGWRDSEEEYVFKPEKGLNENIIREMSRMKGEPQWMLDFRLRAYTRFLRKPVPQWGGGGALNDIDFDNIYYYVKPTEGQAKSWDMVPDSIKSTYEKLGIPEAERKYLAGVTAQYECLRGDARVLTVERGLVPIKELQSGERVFSLNERTGLLETAKIKAAAQTDVRQTYRLEVGDRVVYATDNHPFLRLEGEERVWRTLAELVVGDLVAVAASLPDVGRVHTFERPNGTPAVFPRTTDDEVAWLLGCLFGGASIVDEGGRGRYCVDWTLAKGEVVGLIAGVFARRFELGTQQDGDVLSVDSKSLVRFLMRNGMIGHLQGRRLPAWMFGLPKSQRVAFLRGVLDAAPTTLGAGMPISVDLAELAAMVSPAATERTITEHLGFATVSAISEADISAVFDIEVDGPHNFVAEGIIVHNSEVVYHRNREDLEKLGVLFCDMDTAVREYPDLVKEYFGTIIPPNDNKFAALNSAVWSGGSFIYCPPGVHVDQPLQAYFRINSENMGQFERTMIIIDEGAFVHYVEGCLPAGEWISMADGDPRPIEQIKVGDRVLSQHGRPVRVKAFQVRDHRGPLYRFTPVSPDNAFQVTGEHPLLVVRRQNVLVKRQPRNGWQPEVNSRLLKAATPTWVEAKDVDEGDFLVFPKPRPHLADVLLVDELARLAGYYLADGSASLVNGHKTLAFSFNINDTESVDDVRRICKDLYETEGSIFWNEEKNEARVLVYTIAGYETMRNHVGTRSHSKRLSSEFMAQDDSFLAQLVETYVRGDGNVTTLTNRRWVRAHTTSREWAHQLQAILARLGTYATIRLERRGGAAEIMGRPVTRHDLYQVQWTVGRASEVRDAGDYFLVPIKHRDVSDFNGLVYNLDVEAPDSYLASGFAVHNCSAPVYSTDSLHSAVVEIVVKRGGRCRYTTIQNWSNNVFNLVTKRAAAYADATMEWIDGNIGCLAEGSRVTTPSGSKPIELLQPGEDVLSYDDASGKLAWRKVTAKRFSGYQQVREVRTGERRLLVTDNHPFYSYRYDPQRPKKLGRYRLGYVRADHLSHAIVPTTSLDYGHPHKLEQPSLETTFVGSNQYQTGYAAARVRAARLDVPEHTTDELMWLFGLFLGDGSIDSKPSEAGGRRWAKVVFSVPTGDRAHQRLLEVMNRLAPEVHPSVRADGIAVTWNSVDLADLFESNGLVSGALEKRLPEWVLDLPESQRVALLAGLLDSDGCAARGRRGFSIKSVNRPLLEDASEVLTSLGIRARINTEHEGKAVRILGYESTSRGSHRLDFPLDRRLLAEVSDPLREAGRQQVPVEKNEPFRRVGRSTIELPESVEIHRVAVGELGEVVPTWDIEVEGTGNFVAEGFIVHNSRLTMKYPAVWLMEPGAHGEVLSIAYAGEGQHQDAGAKMVHAAPDTTSTIISKSISKNGGRAGYRGLVRVEQGAERAKSFVRCDALILDEKSRSDTYPSMEIEENDAEIGHEATVSKVGEEQLFYLMSRGLTEEQATSLVVAGFIEPIVRELPMEYAVEMNRLIELNMAEAGAIG